MRAFIPVALALLSLAACAPQPPALSEAEVEARQKEFAAQQEKARAQRDREDQSLCASMGAKKGQKLQECLAKVRYDRAQIDMQRALSHQAAANARPERVVAQAAPAFRPIYIEPQPAAVNYVPDRQNVNCTSERFGSQIQTNCFRY